MESIHWRNKVTPLLLRRYDEAVLSSDKLVQQVVLEYRGSYNQLRLELEVLAALEDQLQVSIHIQDLPLLASQNCINSVKLPGYISV